jgi:FKBP-type peptidyl-prolyl cis-trans isomerase FkpA
MSFAVAALIGLVQPVKIEAGPDVYGPNGSNYQNNSPSEDLSNIGIDISEAGSGDNCKAGDWATVAWTATLMDNRLVSDSKAEGQGLPKVFNLGKGEVFKCWDLAIQQLKKGSKARVTCPAHYAWGNAFTQAPLGGEPIPLNSDIYFDLSVEDCNRVPDSLAWTARGNQPKFTTMQSNNCFYLHNEESEHQSTPLVLNCEAGGCGLEEFVVDDKNQQFFWDEGSQHVYYYPNGLSADKAYLSLNTAD